MNNNRRMLELHIQMAEYLKVAALSNQGVDETSDSVKAALVQASRKPGYQDIVVGKYVFRRAIDDKESYIRQIVSDKFISNWRSLLKETKAKRYYAALLHAHRIHERHQIFVSRRAQRLQNECLYPEFRKLRSLARKKKIIVVKEGR
jgi:hypothetical protein